MAHPEEDRKRVGAALAKARKNAGYSSLEAAAAELNAHGWQIKRGTIGAWEVGRNLPDAIWLVRLAVVYETSVDAMLGVEGAVSSGATRIAQQFDTLEIPEQTRARDLWDAFFKGAQRKAVSGESSAFQQGHGPRRAAM